MWMAGSAPEMFEALCRRPTMERLTLLALTVLLTIGASDASAQGNGPRSAAPQNARPMESPAMAHHEDTLPRAGRHEHGGTGGPSMMHGAGRPGGMPTKAGQAAFGAIQEIVRLLQADPKT